MFSKNITQGQMYKAGMSGFESTKILNQKGLPTDLFEIPHHIQFADDIGTHIQWAFNNIYKVHYPNVYNQPPIARYYHGIQHVTRAAMYVPVFANLYRRYDNKEAKALTDGDVKLLQLAAVFHDAAREDEGIDRWDHESAILLYLYLTKTLKVKTDKAKQIAEAVANKDPHKEGYFTINVMAENQFSWEWKQERPEKNIYQKIIHDVDCLDIIRARDAFDARYLDFYQQYNTNQFAFEEMTHLIMEARSLIDIQGDSLDRTKTHIKLNYENENAYLASSSSVDTRHPIMTALHKKLLPIDELKAIKLVDLTPYDPKLGLTTDANLRAALREIKTLFIRGIGSAATLGLKPLKTGKYITLAQREMLKVKRRPGIKTTTSKNNGHEKEGNDNRSVSRIGYGSGVFANAGFIIFDPNLNDIRRISAIDEGTGHGKKINVKNKLEEISNTEKEKQLSELHNKLKLGGSAVRFPGMQKYAFNHVEILYHVKDYSAIYFSNDPNIYNVDIYGSPEPTHAYSPILEAIFLRNEYQKSSLSKQELPIIEYSGIHNIIRLVSAQELTREKIKAMWVAMCSDYIKRCLQDVDDHKIYHMSVNDIKTLSMYKTTKNKYDQKNAPADSNYDEAFQKEITEAIELERQRLIKEHATIALNKVKENKLSVLSDEAFFNIIRNPGLIPNIQDSITKELSDIDQFDVSSIKDMLINSNALFFTSIPTQEEILSHTDYRTNETIRIYVLAKMINATDICTHIQEEMKKIARSFLDEENIIIKNIEDKITSGNYIDSYDLEGLRKVIVFSVIFDLYHQSNEIRNEIDQLLNKYFGLITDHFQKNITSLSSSTLSSYCGITSYFESIKALTESQYDKVKEMMLLMLKTKPKAIRENAVYSFLKLAQLIQLPVSIESIALTIINNQDNGISFHEASNLVSTLCKFIPLENLALFKLISQKIAINNSNPTNNKIDFKEWFSIVGQLESLFAYNKKFNQDQLNILQERVSQLFNQITFDLKDLNTQTAFVILISQINSFLTEKQKLKLSIPDFIILELNMRLSDPKIYALFLEMLTKLPMDNKKLSVSDIRTLFPEICEQFSISSNDDNNEICNLLSCFLKNIKNIYAYLSEDQKKSSPQLTILLNQMQQYEQITESLNHSSQENQWQVLEKWVATIPKEHLTAINRSDLHHPHLERCVKLEIEKSKFENLWHDENALQENIAAFLAPSSSFSQRFSFGIINTYEDSYTTAIIEACTNLTKPTDLYHFLTKQLEDIDRNANKSATFWSNHPSASGDTAMRILFIRHKVAEIMNNPLTQQLSGTKHKRGAVFHC